MLLCLLTLLDRQTLNASMVAGLGDGAGNYVKVHVLFKAECRNGQCRFLGKSLGDPVIVRVTAFKKELALTKDWQDFGLWPNRGLPKEFRADLEVLRASDRFLLTGGAVFVYVPTR